MLTQIRLELDHDDINFRKASNLQGVLMKAAGSDFAAKMHLEGQHSYSQYVCRESGKSIWVINALNTSTSETLRDVLMSPEFDRFSLRFGREGVKTVHVLGKSLYELDEGELIKEFQNKNSVNSFQITFATTTAFKQQGNYVVLPNPRLFFQSLIMKCNAVTDLGGGMDADPDMLVKISEMVGITKYSLHTEQYPFEKTWVPGCMGTICFKIHGDEMMKRYIRFLLRFGEYSGVGIKTGMGMGGIQVKGERAVSNDNIFVS